MPKITIDIANPQIENYLYNISKSKKQPIENLIYSIIVQYFKEKKNQDTNYFSHDYFRKLIKQSENDYKTGKVTTQENFENEILLW